MIVRMLVQNTVFLAVFAALLFLPAGRADWPQAWAFLAVLGASSLAVGFALLRTDPELLRQRMTLPTHTAQRLSDRLLFLLIFAAFVAWFAAMGFEARFAAPAWGPLGQALGATLILACMWIAWRTFRENSFATPDVRVQAERGQRVISTGPYAVVRHPLYAGAVLWMVGAPLLLGSRWGFIGAAVLIALMAQRALEEEKVLAEGLAGYGDYRRKVRFRFVPGVW